MDDDGSWQMSSANLGNTSMGIVPNCNPGVDSFCSTIWEGFGDANIRANLSSSSLLGAGTIDFEPSRSPANGNFGPVWNPPIGMFKGPQFLPQFQVDSGLIDRAARFSCFSGGNMSDMMNPFSTLECMNSHSKPQDVSVGNDKKSESIIHPRERAKEGEIESDGFECSDRCGQDLSENAVGQSSAKGLGSKKRKRNGSRGVEAANEQTEMPGGENEKQAGSQTSDPRKEEYIHVRARRGQATNSHSLAERVRREKISERMKFLQDLVPGCNKVIGKAVMLDEIINYVQSLQRQVEFLSMKLATINPRLDFNADVVFPKDISRAGPSSSLAFPPDMAIQYPPVHPLQPMLIQGDLPGLETSGGALHRTINSQLTKTSETNNDPTSKVSNLWNDELHNVFQTGFNSTAPLSSQYTSSLPPDDHMKTEP